MGCCHSTPAGLYGRLGTPHTPALTTRALTHHGASPLGGTRRRGARISTAAAAANGVGGNSATARNDFSVSHEPFDGHTEVGGTRSDVPQATPRHFGRVGPQAAKTPMADAVVSARDTPIANRRTPAGFKDHPLRATTGGSAAFAATGCGPFTALRDHDIMSGRTLSTGRSPFCFSSIEQQSQWQESDSRFFAGLRDPQCSGAGLSGGGRDVELPAAAVSITGFAQSALLPLVSPQPPLTSGGGSSGQRCFAASSPALADWSMLPLPAAAATFGSAQPT